jgi:outer membrane protein TolC/ABC-type uncharacterized transport system substrate-binding protein
MKILAGAPKYFPAVFVVFSTMIPLPVVSAEVPSKKVIYLSDGESSYVKRVSTQLKQELASLAEGRYKPEFLPDQNAGWVPDKAAQLLAEALSNQEIDLVIVSGINLTLAVLGHIPPSKPVIVADFIEPEFLGLPRTAKDTSGVSNLTYIAKTKGAAADFLAFRKILRFKTLHILLDDTYRRYADRVLEKIGKMDFEIKLVPASGSVSDILAAIDQEKIEALYLPPLRLSEADFEQLINGINKRKIPTFSAFGHEAVEKGVLAGRIPKFFTKFSRRVAMNADRMLQGEDAAAIAVVFELEDKMVINQRTADQIGLSIPFDVLLEAEVLFYGEPVGGEVLTLHQAVKEALASNLNFRILDEQIKSAGKDYWLAWTQYLPAVDFRLDYDINDSERAKDIPRLPKWTYQYGISLTQLVFSHPIFFQIANAKKQVKVEKLRRASTTLEITDQTVSTYLAYLSAKALHKVALDNLKAIEVNLDVAEKRRQTGAGGPEEVLRWQSELAEQKSTVLQRESEIYQARTVLNQLMNRPQDQLFLEQDIGLETVQHYIGSQYVEPYIENFKSLMIFLEYATKEALANSPEIQALQIGVEQQRNNVRSADGRFFLPEATLAGDVRHEIKHKFYQREPANPSDDWEVNLRLSYPLFDQGRRPLDSLKQRNELHRLEFFRDLRKQEVERGLRQAAYDMYTSLPSIKLRREAMASASENYEIVEKKYNEGIVNITELIDAQTNKFNRQAAAVTAIYVFLNDLSNFDRQLATYYMLATEQERGEWLQKLRQYLEQKGVAV